MLDDAARRAVIAGIRNGLSRQDAAARTGISEAALGAEIAADPRFELHCAAAADPSLRGGRWSCPGWHCGSYTGYQYGCREPECAASVPAEKQRRRRRAGKQGRSPFGPAERTEFLRLVAAGAAMYAASSRLGVSPYRIRGARREEPGFEEALRAAMSSAGRQLRDLKQEECPGQSCGTPSGYHVLRCRRAPCVSAKQAREQKRRGATPGSPQARRFGTADAERYIALISTGLTVTEAARQAGWNLATVYYARKGDRGFDARVVAASAAARTPGPGGRVRPISRE